MLLSVRFLISSLQIDGFAEANLLLSTAIQEFEELEATMRENGELGSADGQTRAIC